MSINELFQELKKSNEKRARANAKIQTQLNDALALSAKLNESLESWGQSLDESSKLLDQMAKRKQFCGQSKVDAY